jgi:hypothetical protein
MLRHIISVSLALTACAALIPTKANAASFTFTPVGEIQQKPNDSVEFVLNINPAPSTVVKILSWIFYSDDTELSGPTAGTTVVLRSPIDSPTTIFSRTFNVLTPVKDGISDFTVKIFYEESESGSSATPTQFEAFFSGADVVPVPEPLTIFGTATGALGYGAMLKRRSSKKTVS